MPHIQQTALMPYTPAQMYDLVRDVVKYPLFLPWCGAAIVHEETAQMQKASLTIVKGPIRKRFTTHNTCVPHESIAMRLVEGPFHHLQGAWQFSAEANGSRIHFDLDFSVRAALFAKPLAMVFQQAANQMVQAFQQRAEFLYHDQR